MTLFTDSFNQLHEYIAALGGAKFVLFLLLMTPSALSSAADLAQLDGWRRSLSGPKAGAAAVTYEAGPRTRVRRVVTPDGSETTTVTVSPSVRLTCGSSDAVPREIAACVRALDAVR
jgi:hypothetical protein